MKVLKLLEREYLSIIEGSQNHVISLDGHYEMNDSILLSTEGHEDSLAKITSKTEFKSIEEVFNVLPLDLFGNFTSQKEAIEFYSSLISGEKYYVYRVKYDSDTYHELLDDQLIKLIDMNSITKNNIGHSVCEVLEVKLKNGSDAILKVQFMTGRNSLSDEYERLTWLKAHEINSPSVYYFNRINDVEYLLMEKIVGLPAFKYSGLCYKLGKELRKIHDLYRFNPSFTNNSTDELLKQVLNKIDSILPQIFEMYPDFTRDSVIQFMIDNKPENDVLVHGDYSLPNLLVDKCEKIGFIDLGDVSVSSKYFDFFYFVKSLKRNKKIDELPDFMRGYGIDEFDPVIMKWMEIMDIIIY